jgi:hypothetical protein
MSLAKHTEAQIIGTLKQIEAGPGLAQLPLLVQLKCDGGVAPWLRQTVKTQFAVRCKFIDRQDHFSAF